MLHRVKKAEHLSGYRLKLEFTNGRIKIVDLERMLKGKKNMFLQLLDPEYFKKVECDGYSICWPNGIDFCPDLLYKSGEDIARPKKKHKRSVSAVKPRRRSKRRILSSKY
jgi:hypothetical protein